MDEIGILMVLLPMAVAIFASAYGLTKGFGAWGRTLPGRLVLRALDCVTVPSLLGALLGALEQNDPWAPTYHKVGFWEAVAIHSLTWAILWGIPAALVGAILTLLLCIKTKRRERKGGGER